MWEFKYGVYYNVIYLLVFFGKEDIVIIVYFVYCKLDFCIEMWSNLLIFVLWCKSKL